MPVDVRIPSIFRKHTGEQKSVVARPGTLQDLLDSLRSDYPALVDDILTESGELHRFVNIYLNDEDIRYMDGLETRVSDGDVLAILPAVAGGSPLGS